MENEQTKTQTPETPIFFVRRHWFVILPHFLIISFFTLFFILIIFTLFYFFPILSNDPYKDGIVVFASIFLLIMLFSIFLKWINYYFDIGVLTETRFIDIDQLSIFHRTISEMSLDKLQDVKVDVKGFFKTYFNYGDVIIETAGSSPNFVLNDVPKPYVVSQKILETYHHVKKDDIAAIADNDEV